MSLMVGVSRVHFPVTGLGPGHRVGIWFQGCSIRCPGCMSRDTWSRARTKTSLKDLMSLIEPWLERADGVTISGGEPFDQPEALRELLTALRPAGRLSTLVYSGYAFEALQARHADILAVLDVLISEPFDESDPQRKPLRGSANQRVHCFTDAGVTLWRQAKSEWSLSGAKLDLIAGEDGALWLAGVPGPGDLERLSRQLGSAGLALRTSAGRLGEQ